MRDGIGSTHLPGFAELVEGFDGLELERHEHAAYGLKPDLTLAYLNPAWFDFARQNGGESIPEHWGLGSSVLDATTGPARDLYEDLFLDCLKTRRPRRKDYECSSALQFRRFHMDIYPIRERRGLLVINSIFVDHPRSDRRAALPPLEASYADADGLVVQCSFCRRVRRAGAAERWDWVPDWVEDPPANVTGGVCQPCLQAYFGPPAALPSP